MAHTLEQASANVRGLLPAVKLTRLPASLFKIPPSPEPRTLPPPPDHPNLAHPFEIPADWYNALLNPYVPLTIALIYATTVTYLNSLNARRKWKPWRISKTGWFKIAVILHNTFLAVYSAWTFVGMTNALKLTIPNWRDEHGVAGIVDSLCKIQGPRGLGNAATYNEQSSAWTMTNRVFHLAADGLTPERSDVGRMWNEGLAFYGWIFYLSKFYEVIDTAIILAKGKKSSFLQTYHHAGAMLCMWAGIRYMSPPIWMFCFVNSGIHALMYTFYLCSALKIHVPKRLKRTLTTMQITQFVVGASFAFLHLFVSYQIPISVPYLYHVAPKVASMAASDASSAASSVVASVTADAGSLLRKFALRAAGYEGLAENLEPEAGAAAITGYQPAITQRQFASAEERYRDELQWVHCLDTSGQAYAILLNLVYLAPLTWLFVRFFIKAYMTQLERRRSSAAAEQARIAGISLGDASKGVARRLSQAVIEMAGDSSDTDSPIVESSESVDTLKKKAAAEAEKAKASAQKAGKLVADKAKTVADTVQGQTEKVAAKAQAQAPSAGAVKDNAAAVADSIKKDTSAAEDVKEKAQESIEKVEDTQESSSMVTEDKTFAEAVKEEPESAKDENTSSENPVSPNGDGTGADEATGPKSEGQKSEEIKKEQEEIIDDSQPVRDEDKDKGDDSGMEESGQEEATTNGNSVAGQNSQIPRPKKKKNKKA